ncbi:hypothetical protein Rin_00013730 [Candidatus Regiella insecticola 5.15]|uniref:Uncharacterized protein n=2 Tax=Candidatus Regiella insecticola TaxID=138073 RepID=G2GZZ3_9ENTR|nr:hypothetical protein Rin_00013730 [Candidatus Regiella insecticola 5.15]
MIEFQAIFRWKFQRPVLRSMKVSSIKGRRLRKDWVIWLEQFNLIQGVGAKTVQTVRQATTTQDQIKLLQPYNRVA